MYNVDQQLFSYCTGKSTDNTQCCVPVFDITHELPLCHEHFSKAVSDHFKLFVSHFSNMVWLAVANISTAMQTYIEDGIGLKYVKHRNMQDSVKDC